MLYQDFYESPLGIIHIIADDFGIFGLYFTGQQYYLKGFEDKRPVTKVNQIIQEARHWLDAYFGGAPLPDVSLSLKGTNFQMSVWKTLRDIQLGQTVSYGYLAKLLDCKSPQAIGSAVGKNPVMLIVPCHRIIGSDGQLRGYAGGLERKSWLLNHEKRY